MCDAVCHTGTQRVTVSSLLVCYGLLLVGTNLGMTVALSVPRLQGIPKVTGESLVSRGWGDWGSGTCMSHCAEGARMYCV